MENPDNAIFDSANRRVRILGWLTVAIAVAPQVLTLPLLVYVVTHPHTGPHPDIGGGISCFLAILAASWTLVWCLAARGLFRYRPWARVVTLVLTAVVFILTLLVGVGVSLYWHNELEEYRRSPFQSVSGLDNVRRECEFFMVMSFLPFLVLSPYCFLAHLWLWKRPVCALFCNPGSTDRKSIPSPAGDSPGAKTS